MSGGSWLSNASSYPPYKQATRVTDPEGTSILGDADDDAETYEAIYVSPATCLPSLVSNSFIRLP